LIKQNPKPHLDQQYNTNNPNKKKKKLYLHLIPHFQRIQVYHTNPENLVSNLFQFESFMKKTSFETMHGYKFMVNLLILTSSKAFHAIVSPTTLHHPSFIWQRCHNMDGSWVSMEECMQPQHCL
jgi:hypothetical protein